MNAAGGYDAGGFVPQKQDKGKIDDEEEVEGHHWSLGIELDVDGDEGHDQR